MLTTTSRRLSALVVMDPAAGPGFSDSALQTFSLPVLVIGSVQNDFLPYSFHAGRVSERLHGAEVVRLDAGEGHFIYLDVCGLPVEAMGVPLCSDRRGIDRESVHGRLASVIEPFLADHLGMQNAAE
jgi:predicted dienelactone hydrolase